MDTIDIDCQGGNAWALVPRFMRGEVHDEERIMRLFYVDSGGHELASLDMDFSAASELMIWLNTNIHRVMTHPDDSARLVQLAPTSPAAPAPAPAHLSMRQLRVKCWTCSATAEFVAITDNIQVTGTPSCVTHRGKTFRGLPIFTDLQLYMLKLVDMERGLSTSEYANRGGASWTVRGTGNVLYRLERYGLVVADKRTRPRRWHLTPQGALVAPYILDPGQIGL